MGTDGLSIGAAAVQLGGNENLTSLSMTDPSGTLSVAEAKTLTITQTTTNTTAAGLITLTGASGGGAGAGLTLAGTQTMQITVAPALGKNSALAVNGSSTLRLNVTSGTPTVSTGVTATVAAGATLDLAGSIPALSDAAPTSAQQRVDVLNAGTLTVDPPTMGSVIQQVGGIDPNGGTAGSVVVNDGANLMADHINQTSLVIGSGSTFTLAPSNSDGSPMVGVGLALAGSLRPSSSFLASSNSLLAAGATDSTPRGLARRREWREYQRGAGAIGDRVARAGRHRGAADVPTQSTMSVIDRRHFLHGMGVSPMLPKTRARRPCHAGFAERRHEYLS